MLLQRCAFWDHEREAVLADVRSELAASCCRSLGAILTTHRSWVRADERRWVPAPVYVERTCEVGKGLRQRLGLYEEVICNVVKVWAGKTWICPLGKFRGASCGNQLQGHQHSQNQSAEDWHGDRIAYCVATQNMRRSGRNTVRRVVDERV